MSEIFAPGKQRVIVFGNLICLTMESPTINVEGLRGEGDTFGGSVGLLVIVDVAVEVFSSRDELLARGGILTLDRLLTASFSKFRRALDKGVGSCRGLSGAGPSFLGYTAGGGMREPLGPRVTGGPGFSGSGSRGNSFKSRREYLLFVLVWGTFGKNSGLARLFLLFLLREDIFFHVIGVELM